MTEKKVNFDLTNEQVDNIVTLVIERILNRMPKVIGNLMAQQATANKLKKDFYSQYPEFDKHKDVVVNVISKLEGKNLTIELEEILIMAVPEIRKKISMKDKLNTEGIQESEDINKFILPETDIDNANGVI